jgi:hypothetical protein
MRRPSPNGHFPSRTHTPPFTGPEQKKRDSQVTCQAIIQIAVASATTNVKMAAIASVAISNKRAVKISKY